MGQIRVQSETVSPSNRRADRREISRVVYQEEGDREEGGRGREITCPEDAGDVRLYQHDSLLGGGGGLSS